MDVFASSLVSGEINYQSVSDAVILGLITDLRNQTYFKNEDGTYASIIDVAKKNKDFSLMRYLFNQKVIITDRKLLGRPLFHWIMSDVDLNRDVNLIKKLIDEGHDINCQDPNAKDSGIYSPLSRALMWKKLDVAKLFINNGANINPPCVATDYNCFSCLPLSLAIENKLDPLVDLLLKNGADINQQCKFRGTSLHAASENGDIKLFQRLLDGDADVNALCSVDKRTPLHIALINGKLQVLMILLNDYRIDLNSTYQRSIVHDAVTSDALNCINHILDVNPDVNFVDEANNLAIDCVKYDNLKNIGYLKKHIVRLRAAGFYLHERNVEAVSGEEYAGLYAECCQQVEKMKTTGISSTSHFSVYDSLLMSKKKLALCLESLDDPGILESGFYKKFSLYSGMLEFIFKKAYQWIELREAVRSSIHILFNKHLPTTITEKIITYFSLKELAELRKNSEKIDPRESNKNQKTSHSIPIDVDG